jgi:hypothetical protein
MTTLAASPSSVQAPVALDPPRAGSAGSTLRAQAAVAAVVLAAFTAFSLWCVYGHGYTGFLTLAGREPWALQMLLDLVIAVSFALGWLRADARRRGLAWWPYFAIALFLGSIGLLAYLVRRGLAPAPATPRPGT